MDGYDILYFLFGLVTGALGVYLLQRWLNRYAEPECQYCGAVGHFVQTSQNTVMCERCGTVHMVGEPK